jgi:ATP-binding cassette subfamily C protein
LLLLRAARLLGEVGRFQPRRLTLVATLATVSALAEGAGILSLVPLLNRLGLNGDAIPPGRFELALVFYVMLVAGAALAVAKRQLAAARLNLEFVDHMRRRLHAAVLAMGWRAYSRLRASDLSHGLTHDVDLTHYGVEFLLNLGGVAVQAGVALAVVIALSPPLAGLAVLAGLLVLPLGGRLNRQIYQLGQQAGLAWQGLMADLATDLVGFRLVKTFGLAATRRAAFDSALLDVRTQELALRRAVARNSLVTRILAAVAAGVVLLLAVRGFGLAPARILAVMVALARLLQVGGRLVDGWRNVVHALPAHARALRLLARCRQAAEIEPPSEPGQPPRQTEAIESIQLKGVSVSYASDRAPALSNLSITIAGGGLTVVMGPSGAGKSTLGDVLLGLIGPDAGEMLVNGRTISRENRGAWRRRTSLLPQDPTLFGGTIRSNLVLADARASDAQLWQALTEAGADGFVRALRLGLDSGIGDRGVALSGGECQRLALARALLRRPDLLVLDEPTSALDATNEAHILASLRGLRGKATIVLITHRTQALDHADQVIRLDHGRAIPNADRG